MLGGLAALAFFLWVSNAIRYIPNRRVAIARGCARGDVRAGPRPARGHHPSTESSISPAVITEDLVGVGGVHLHPGEPGQGHLRAVPAGGGSSGPWGRPITGRAREVDGAGPATRLFLGMASRTSDRSTRAGLRWPPDASGGRARIDGGTCPGEAVGAGLAQPVVPGLPARCVRKVVVLPLFAEHTGTVGTLVGLGAGVRHQGSWWRARGSAKCESLDLRERGTLDSHHGWRPGPGVLAPGPPPPTSISTFSSAPASLGPTKTTVATLQRDALGSYAARHSFPSMGAIWRGGWHLYGYAMRVVRAGHGCCGANLGTGDPCQSDSRPGRARSGPRNPRPGIRKGHLATVGSPSMWEQERRPPRRNGQPPIRR